MISDNHISINVPVLSHIKKFLEQNTFLKRPFRLTSTDPVGVMIMMLLKTPPKYAKPIKSPYTIQVSPVKPGELVYDHLTLSLAGYSPNRKNYLSHQAINVFNNWVESLIKWEMYIYVESMQATGTMKTRPAIKDFMAKYDISEDDLSFHQLEKYYYRKKKKTESLDA